MNYVKRPEPGRYIGRERVIEKIIEKQSTQQPIDIMAIANAVALAINSMPHKEREYVYNQTKEHKEDNFDNSKTLAKLADSMIIQSGNNRSNFDNLGNEQKTQTNKEETDKTIDLLSDIDG